MDITGHRRDAAFRLIDLADYPLPHLDEPLPPSHGQYQNAHSHQWAATIAQCDGFIMLTPEYNHSTAGVLKNASAPHRVVGQEATIDGVGAGHRKELADQPHRGGR